MALTPEAAIMAALLARVGTITTHTADRISWPGGNDGEVYVPPNDRDYLEVKFVPNITNRFLIGSTAPHQRLGLLQLSVHYRKKVKEILIRERAGLVAAHFPCDLHLGTEPVVRITSAPNVTDMMTTKVDVVIPVMIEWECFA